MSHQGEIAVLSELLAAARAPRRRGLRAFAEQEIVLPNGPYEGMPWRAEYQPSHALWFDAIDSGAWHEFRFTGPTQYGKTLVSTVIPALWHLFERRETVVCGIPDMLMAADKWVQDFLPVIEATRYRHLLPRVGRGSRSGTKLEAVTFDNGTTLRFMAGGGGDAQVKGFTAPVLVVTEADLLDRHSGASREATKIRQLIGRTRAFSAETGRPATIYAECTVTVAGGYIWQEYQAGTRGRVELACPHCGAWVTPEREHLVGWQNAKTEEEAERGAAFACPACAVVWSIDDRRQANRAARLVHERPTAKVCTFRATAAVNLFAAAADLGREEWRAMRAVDAEDANRDLCQQVWCTPPPEPEIDLTSLDFWAVCQRAGRLPRGHVPATAEHFVAAIDLGKWQCHWVALAFLGDGTPHVVDYNALTVNSHAHDVSAALLLALREWRDLVEAGWPIEGRPESGPEARRVPQAAWIDTGWQAEVGYQFLREAGGRYAACKGLGVSQDGERKYSQPRSTGNVVRVLGRDYHAVLLAGEGLLLWEINADAWKGWLHERLSTPVGQPGGLTLFAADPKEHLTFAQQLVAEKQISEFVAGRGTVVRWDNVRRRPNHYLDATYMACAAGHWAGARLMDQTIARPAGVGRSRPAPPRRGLRLPDGRPFLVTQR